METEHWALFVSFLALMTSIGLPIWIRRGETKEKAANRRSLLLQKIVAVKSLAYTSRFQLVYLLQRHSEAMDLDQREALQAQVPRIEDHEKELWKLHKQFLNYDDNSTLMDIEKTLSHVIVAESEISDLARLIEDGAKSYE